jgi:hypothetical protein
VLNAVSADNLFGLRAVPSQALICALHAQLWNPMTVRIMRCLTNMLSRTSGQIVQRLYSGKTYELEYLVEV